MAELKTTANATADARLLLERGKDDSWKPLSAQASPADIKETLAALLKSCSPRYASLWTQELEKRLASLATDCGKDDD
eukprot:g80482.t1